MQLGGIHIAKIFGIDIWLDYSWLIVFFLVFISFTAGLLPSQFPGMTWPVSLATGLVTTVVFFGSVVVHELSHSLYAKRQKLHIKRITLFVFGGASELTDEPKSPKQEFWIAIAGPLASLGLAAIFLLIWLLGRALGFTPLIAGSGILAAINFMLAVFNLLPGFPLDGGRIFRSLVWLRTGSLERATRYAATGGRILGAGLALIGILEALFARSPGGLWLILIGLFLYQSAGLSYLQAMSRITLKGLYVHDLMSKNFISVGRNTRVRDLLDKNMLQYKGAAVVVEPDRRHRAGVLDVTSVPRQAIDEPVSKFIAPKGRTLRPRGKAAKALETMLSAGMSRLPVIEKGRLVGIITTDDIQTYIIGKSKLHTR